MKRLSALLAALLLCFSLFAASVKPSMDGRAVVADIGELPIGLFAKSAAFLPGDTVVVTNPATHISIEVMIFGGFDSSEGIAIVLSPEAARELYISKGSNVIVQVTKKTDAWSENTILSKTVESYTPEEDPDVNQEMMIDDIEDPVFDTPGVMVEDVVFYVEEPILPPEEFVEEAAAEPEAPVEEAIPVSADEVEAVEESLDETDVAEEVPVADFVEDEQTVEPVEEATEDVVQERPLLISRGTRFEELTAEDTPAVGESESEEPVAEEKWALIPDEAEFVDSMDEEAPAVEETPAAEESSADEETEAVEETVEEVPVEEEMETADTVDAELADEAEEEVIVETEVILIPTEFFPPVIEGSGQAEAEETVAPEAVEEVAVAVEEIEEEEIEEDSFAEEPDVLIFFPEEEETPAVQEITVVSQNELPKGYYVQILTASKMTTVEDARDLYGKNYPMQYAESSRGGIQVLIGPLTADEYAVIQARFRSYGYKDCFVRNIK